MKIKIINGPNLNMLGIRNVNIYGENSYLDLEKMINKYCLEKNITYDIIQSNYEGKIIEAIHNAYYEDVDSLIINPGAFTHYSYAIRDALEILKCLVIEVHISDIYHREDFRKVNLISDVVSYSVVGRGIHGYLDAIKYSLDYYKR